MKPREPPPHGLDHAFISTDLAEQRLDRQHRARIATARQRPRTEVVGERMLNV